MCKYRRIVKQFIQTTRIDEVRSFFIERRKCLHCRQNENIVRC